MDKVLSKSIQKLLKEDDFHFYDAAAPIIEKDSIDFSKAYYKSRYDKGEDSYINCPMTKEQFEKFDKDTIYCECCNRTLDVQCFSYHRIHLDGTALRCKSCDWIFRHKGLPVIDGFSEEQIKYALEFILFEKSLYINDLANELNVSRQSISKWENGNSTPDLEKIVKLAKIFNVSLDELIKNEEELKNNLSVAAHLIHGSSDDKFKVTYCTKNLSKEEVEGVGFQFMPYDEAVKKYNPETLKDGYNTVDGAEIYYISNPALGLWTV